MKILSKYVWVLQAFNPFSSKNSATNVKFYDVETDGIDTLLFIRRPQNWARLFYAHVENILYERFKNPSSLCAAAPTTEPLK